MTRLPSCGRMLSAFFLLSITPALAIWPVPEKSSTGEQTLWIANDVPVTYNSEKLSWSLTATECTGFSSKEVVTGAVSRTLKAILEDNLVPWMLYERQALQQTEPSASEEKKFITSISISHNGTEGSWKSLSGDVDESYSLSLSTQGAAKIQAGSSVGVLRALETFSQLFFQHSDGSGTYTTQAPVEIIDKPQYEHRGILLDVSRSYFSVESIYRTIDAMSWNKLNRLHIHATDSQSWPLEIPALPELSDKGAYAKGKTYTPEDVESIQKYALQRGVEVIFEVDTPGHFGVAALAYPDLVAAWQAAPWQNYCAEPPCGQLKLDKPEVDDFLDTLMNDLLPRTNPYSSLHHIGGDEVNFNAIALDETVGTNDSAVIQPLMQKFFDKHYERLSNHGVTPIVWEEFPLNYNVTMGTDVVVQSWLGDEAVKDLVSRGFKTIVSNYNFWYLDCGRGHWLNFDNGASFTEYYPFNDWCTPAKGWRLIYSYNPRAGLSPEEAKLIIGGEVASWTESIDEVTIDSILWPRSSALGEVLWSGRVDADGRNRSQIDAAPRLAEFRERMVARGVGSAPVHMPFCTQGMNATACELAA
ncbi:putative glycoside hydrolase family 20 protein [Eutypa lata UCREL1]|uniref:Beta-hexosaminidase n=1 Tax=Eutypa lata (strain UCR-EL1) TaxID=1287681 RepID=M7T8N7_EUTLA|nr:putative glycoside hydrolase family 20 protein [Eutypa lata UCREL1]